MLRASLKWRDEFKPFNITAKELDNEASSGKLFRYGKDKLGRPVVYITPAL